ncbi:MAG: hypothetical protein KKA19_10070, partial [Candidatus Margulisbacteria bacterium]|nr:hypothetical protein [Candidatus Margulisiibacteriota bacterium]
MHSKPYCIHLGISGFPFGTAAVYRCTYIYKLLIENNLNMLVINNRAFHPKSIPIKISKKGKFQGIKYLYTLNTPYRSNSPLIRIFSRSMGRINELLLLIKLKLKGQLDIAFFYPE